MIAKDKCRCTPREKRAGHRNDCNFDVDLKPGLDRAREIVEVMVGEHQQKAKSGDNATMLEEAKLICILGEVSQRIKDNGKKIGGRKKC